MARRRYQRGGLRLIDGQWKLEWREDVLQPDGRVSRVRRTENIGSADDLPTERLARRVADAVLEQSGINHLSYLPGKVATFQDFSELWEKDLLSLSKPSTQSADLSRLRKHLRPALGRQRLESIHPQLVQGLVSKWSSAGLSPKSVKNIVTLLETMTKAAREWGYTAPELTSKVRVPARKLRAHGKTFTVAEAKRILMLAPAPWDLLFTTAALTGLRSGELLGLKWQDIDFGAAVIHIERSVWRGELQATKTDGSDRTVPMPRELAVELERYRAHWVKNELGLLWASEAGTPLDADNLRHRVIRPLLTRAGITGKAGLHAFRHLLGTLLVSTGCNPKVAQAQLGHSDVQTTLDLYVNVISDDHRAAVAKVARVLALDGAGQRPNGQGMN